MSTLTEPSLKTPPPLAGVLKGLDVLLIDDDLGVLKLTQRMLEGLGCQVVATADPLTALGLFDQGAFDLVLTDVVMPEMTGPTLVEQLRQRDPELPVVYMSGYAAAALIAEIFGYQDPLLAKPFAPDELALYLAAAYHGYTTEPA